MKRSFKVSALCLFAVLLAGCLPQQKLTGRVMDTTGPMPGAAVLAMVWIEDAGKALPAPDIRNLAQMDLDIVLEKDMKDRGLPAAYARAFTDEKGMFDLDTLHFSAETKKAVKVMAQPKISRITLNAFQRGYLKHAATVFPKDISKELSPAVVRLSKPESWKQLALDNPFRTLRRDEYDQGYSKEFGATKAEKKWFLDYISSNLNEAYQVSNIKGDKQWEEDCGRDFSDIVISSSGMQRNPNQEKCNELLREMGVLRDWEKLWVDHSYAPDARQTPAINAIKEAVNALEAEFAEVKQYESQIIAGAEEAAKEYTAQRQQNLRDGLSETSPLPLEAQNLYSNGDKAGAYKALGHALYSDLPVELKQGIITAMLPTVTLPRIKETTAGFYLLVNRPLTAQLPGGDNGNHKDKPKAEVDKSTNTPANNEKYISFEEEELVFRNAEGELIRKHISARLNIRTEIIRGMAAKGFEFIEAKKLLQPGLKFYSKDGLVLKAIPIKKWERNIIKKIAKNGGGVESLDNFSEIADIASVSSNGAYAFIQRKTREGAIKYMEDVHPKAEWRMFGNNGEQLWERKTSEIIMRVEVSDSGTAIMIVGGEREGGGNEKILVYDKTGEIIYSYPNDHNKVYGIDTETMDISPNGRYMAVCADSDSGIATAFFDLKKGKVWMAELCYIIRSLDNEGIVDALYRNPNVLDGATEEQVRKEGTLGKKISLDNYFGD